MTERLFSEPRRPLDTLSREQVAEILHLRPDAVSAIPEHLLPKRRVGAGRGRTVYVWLDVVRYVLDLEPVDLQAYLDEQLRRAIAPVQPVRVQSHKRERIV